ncbi:unnamed protein product [Cuscuta campestris]|uniref:Anaphase-promoting complex subunit 4 WD40 domain-containing protein n=1 Tax=Cuscuta campestris TaxID=132261 RepID=A0A484NQU5_9ASTE|nr:unnamed protein product [Cuscuta campestris]
MSNSRSSLLPSSPPSTTTSSSAASSDSDESPPSRPSSAADECRHFKNHPRPPPPAEPPSLSSYKCLAVLSGHAGSVSCISLCGEFILSASQGKDITVWQQPDLRPFARFGQGDGSVKAVLTVGNRVFTAHQDSRIRVWKVSSSSSSPSSESGKEEENAFRLVNSLPTRKDYLGRFLKQSNYVQTRRHHKKLWIEHADSISCLAAHNGFLFSGSWDKTLKVWRVSDLKCLESIMAHDDAINALQVASDGTLYSASADGKIKSWRREGAKHALNGVLEGHKDVSLNAMVVVSGGGFVYGAGSDGYVIGWGQNSHNNSNKKRVVCEVKAHEMSVLSLCVMGGFLCSGSADRSIGIWKVGGDGGLFRVGIIKGHEGGVRCLQASPVCVGGGFMLYSGSLDRTLRVWWVPNYCPSGGSTQKVCVSQSVDSHNPIQKKNYCPWKIFDAVEST